MALKDANIGRGLGIEKMGLIQYCGTASAVADNPGLRRPSSLQKGIEVLIQKEGEGVYIENNGQPAPGYNFPATETVVEAGATTGNRIVALDDTLVVHVFLDGADTKLKVRAGIVGNDGTTSWGTIQTINDAQTTDPSLCRLSDTLFAVAYCDVGGSSYLCARIGVVTKSSKGISLKTETEVVQATITTTDGTAICLANTLTIAMAYALTGDGKGYVIASTFNATTGAISAAGSAGEFDDGIECTEISMCSYISGYVSVVYQAGADTNDPITMSCGTVSAGKAVSMSAEVTMAGAASAATKISCVALDATKVAFSWLDSNYVHVNMATISTTTPTKQTEVELSSTTGLFPWIEKLNEKELIVVWADDSDTDKVGKTTIVGVAGSTMTAGITNYFTNESTTENCVTALRKSSPVEDQRKRIAIAFKDVDNTNKGTVIVGLWDKYLMDVRSQVNSAPYILNVFPVPGRKRTGV